MAAVGAAALMLAVTGCGGDGSSSASDGSAKDSVSGAPSAGASASASGSASADAGSRTDDDSSSSESSPPPDAKPAKAKAKKDVEADFRYATAEFGGELRIVDDPRPCSVDAMMLTAQIPGEAEVKRVVGHLKERGWTVEETSATTGSYLRSGDWFLIAGPGPIPPEAKDQAGDSKGAFVLGARGKC
ncbi:hypothetical protein SRB5_68260 [Streptomyces sp. RB5]|uniref:Uncharacterized protein n=1 Tax=Streptomyces smaragdinus TaxID=2585196 RepID=A0A7K0CVD9_9ACTN|nr:hypothetical protein [Streptomyces smaragdinus]